MSDPHPPTPSPGPAAGSAPPLEERYFRKGLGLRTEVKDLIRGDYHSGIVRRFRENGFVLTVGDVTFRLAKEFGFTADNVAAVAERVL